MYTASRAAELTGVPRETLRKWEQRYGVVSPARSEGNYRLYDDDAVRRLSVMRDLVDAGWSPREAARRVMDEPVGSASSAARGPQGLDSPLARLDELAACGQDFDVMRLESLLDKAFAQAELDLVVDEWLMPSLVRLGEAWQRGDVTVAGEHFVSAAVLRRLAQTFHQLPHPPPGAPHAIVGLARGSRHELGVMAFAAVLRSRGVLVTYLGADLPVESWIDTARALQPAAVVLGVPTVDDLPAVREAVDALSSVTTVLVGGAHQRRVRGAEPLGHQAGQAAAGLAERLGSA
ncbi:MerR family transcriptional regulator [Nocardioides hwasunensis]|uniref:MerR family transcriptional regulator n=1 Tax=Nocardioides hwasunensis TaxID=397258 RepID=A0ABR8MGC1_9ACTN|nr:MerR family transcriptional regulator [Nocardioides hwasunensis]MBD3915125.1 MerR family transcriptional regulator [Nocardioides hwasunensis]